MLSQQVLRILWRQKILESPAGAKWLAEQVRAGAQEQHLGPHRLDVPPELLKHSRIS
jgi:hypothetical protein